MPSAEIFSEEYPSSNDEFNEILENIKMVPDRKSILMIILDVL